MKDDTTKRAGAATTLPNGVSKTELIPKSVAAALDKFDRASGLQQLLSTFEKLMLTGPSDALERLFSSNANAGFNRIQRYTAAYQEQFRLPRTLEVMQLVAQLPMTKFESALQAIDKTSFISKAIEAMHSPWVNRLYELRSLRGFVALQGIGTAVNTLPPFGEELGTALRHGLGDWRDTIIWPKQILSDHMARTDFYAGRGFNSELTDFPPEAFGESIGIAGLSPTPSELAAALGNPVPSSKDPGEEKELLRTNKAHDYLLRLETRLRRFIDEAMTAEYGND